jgi:hypothetical protein
MKTNERVGKIVTALGIGLHSINRPGSLLKTSIATLSRSSNRQILCRPVHRTVTITNLIIVSVGLFIIFISRKKEMADILLFPSVRINYCFVRR